MMAIVFVRIRWGRAREAVMRRPSCPHMNGVDKPSDFNRNGFDIVQPA
jgi:hypothetical protein